MKKVLSYCLVIMMAAGIYACKKSKADMIVGKWKIGELNTGMEIPPERKAEFDKQIDELKKTAYFDFKKGGTMEMSMSGKTQKGTWKVTEDGKKFVNIAEGSNSVDSLNILELTDNKFSFSEETRGQKITYTLVK